MHLQARYTELEQVSHEKDIQVASLGSLASEVSMIYGLKANPKLLNPGDGPSTRKRWPIRWTSSTRCRVRRRRASP